MIAQSIETTWKARSQASDGVREFWAEPMLMETAFPPCSSAKAPSVRDLLRRIDQFSPSGELHASIRGYRLELSNDAKGRTMTNEKAPPNADTDSGTPANKPGMLGDGTEEQNLNQPGDPQARITEEEVADTLKEGTPDSRAAQKPQGTP